MSAWCRQPERIEFASCHHREVKIVHVVVGLFVVIVLAEVAHEWQHNGVAAAILALGVWIRECIRSLLEILVDRNIDSK